MARYNTEKFTFAGFTFPRKVGTLPTGPFARRLERMRRPLTGGYYHAPEPRVAGPTGWTFYLDSDFMPGLRWQWCDDVSTSIQHTGWFLDDCCDENIRGIVLRLPHGRGFLAGWSMGENFASTVDSYIWDNARDAAHAADRAAESVAEQEREYREEQEPDNG